MIAILAFVPPDVVKVYYEQYSDSARNLYNNNCDSTNDYFENTYIDRLRRDAPQRVPLLNRATMEHFSWNF